MEHTNATGAGALGGELSDTTGGMNRGLWAAVAVAALGCSGTDVGNGRTRLNLLGYEQPPRALTLASGVRIDSVHVVVWRVRLQPGTLCDGDDGEIDIDRVLVADLVGQGLLNPREQREWPLNSDTFCELRLDLHRLEAGEPVPAGTPPELVDRTIRMQGARQDGVPFVVESEISEELELAARNGSFEIAELDSSLIVAFDLSSWVAALQLDALGAAPILVNKDENGEQLSRFEDAVKLSMRLFRDDNGDDDLSADEHAPGDELAD